MKLTLLFLALLLTVSSAFTSTTTTTQSLHGSSTALHAEQQRRRAVFGWIKKSVVAATVGRVVSGSKANAATVAPVESAIMPSTTTGKIVEFTINNLDGVAGNSGKVRIQLIPEWAPKGAARFEELTKLGFWDNCRIFRVVPGFISQFGINGDPKVQQEWRGKSITDDPVKVSNERGTVVFATGGPNTRTTQIFFNTREQGNAFLDKQGFAPFGRVIEGMDVVDKMYAGYGEGAPAGRGPNQAFIQLRGNQYLNDQYPKLSYIEKGILE